MSGPYTASGPCGALHTTSGSYTASGPYIMSGPYLPLAVLYLVQGFPYGLQSGLLPVLLRTQGLSLSHIGLTRFLYLPWLLKFLWSPLVDGAWHRQTWLVLSTGGLCLCCALCSMLPLQGAFTPLAWLLFVMHVLSSMQDVALDAVTVAVLDQDQLGLGNSIQVVAYKLGSVLAGGGALTLLHSLGWRGVFMLLSGAYLMAVLCARWSTTLKGEESRLQGKQKKSSKPRLMEIIHRVSRTPGTMWTMVYVLIYKLGEQGSLSMVPLLLLDRGTSPAELGLWTGIFSLGFSIAGSAGGGAILRKGRALHPLLRTLFTLRVSCLLLQTLLLASLGEDTSVVKALLLLTLMLQNFLAGVITTATFTLMMHCTRRAHKKVQASHYSLLSSLEVLGKVVFSAVSGLLVDSLGVSASFSLFIVLSLLPIAHLQRLPSSLQ
ncbi:major facilitator superfamily domain-containing protein 3 [Anomaloglossus baeobatrachus]|uniref:major facilitator superfamily domain-containing protein 3 n=1 Tax=Anomaloglossus baeobatrachus TaxID=238106 RepID=UPI003F502209